MSEIDDLLNEPHLGGRQIDRVVKLAHRLRGDQATSNTDLIPGHTHVYVCRDETMSVLYVGISSNVEARRAAHRQKPWWTSSTVMTVESSHELRADAETRERELIQKLSPLYNIQHGDPVRALERAREQWAEVSYDVRAINLVLAIAEAQTPSDFERCQRLAWRCLFECLPSDEKRKLRAADKAEQREAERVRLVRESGEAWYSVDEWDELGGVYKKSLFVVALRSGALEGKKFAGVWHTTADRIDRWIIGPPRERTA